VKEITFLKNPPTPLNNQILIEIEDTYDLKKSKGGVLMPNAAHFEAEADSTGFNLSEWIIRTGTVHTMPRELSMGDYDWQPNDEIKVGDEVYWSISRFFNYPVIQTDDKKMFLIVDFHDLIVKKVEGKPVPINGFYLFIQMTSERKIFEHTIVDKLEEYKIVAIGEDVVYEHEPFNFKAEWEVGDRCVLMVPPFRLEAETSQEFDKKYFLAQKRHILMGK
jgi:hypothetical protein